MQLGPVLELSPPISSRAWRRFSFLFTTGDRLLTAVDMTDLTIPQSQIRTRLLRDRAGSIPPTEIPL
jgi:hypothetical protein